MEDKDKLITELKAENEQLKALCDTYRICYQAKHSDIKGMLFKYRTTLQEIKAIANINAVNTCWSILNKCDTCKEAKECGLQSPLEKLKTILDLITKAEEE